MHRLATVLLVSCCAVSASAQDLDGSGQAAAVPPVPAVVEGSGATEVAAPRPEVVVTVEFPGEPTGAVGERVPAVVAAQIPPELALVAVNVVDNRFVEVASDDAAEPVEGALRRGLELAVYRSGRFQAAVELVLIDGDGAQQRYESAPFTLDIRSSIINETNPEPAPSDPPMPVLTRDMRPVWAGVGLGCVLLGFLGSVIWRRREQVMEAVADLGPRRPAWEIALEQLERLEADDLLGQGEHLSYHMRLSEILRAYVGARFGFPAPEMTTTEISAWMASRAELVGGYREEIVSVLADMDMVKFARFVPPRDLSDACFDATHRLVMELSARERQLADEGDEASGDGTPAAQGAPAAPQPSPDAPPQAAPPAEAQSPHAPSPSSTTDAFAPDPGSTDDGLPDNVVPMRRPTEEETR